MKTQFSVSVSFLMRVASFRNVLLCAALSTLAVVQPTPVTSQTAANPTAPQVFNPVTGRVSGELQMLGELISSNEFVYGESRSTISYRNFTLTADRLILDSVTLNAEAEGNVVITGPDEEIRASSLRYNFRTNEGVAFDVEGVQNGLFFRSEWDEATNGPSFRRLSEDEALFRGASYTQSGFPVPTSYVKGSEVILIPGERFFIRDASFWFRGVPVFYLPFYSRGFADRTPWSFEAGFLSDYGAYARVTYQIYFKTETPRWDLPGEYVTRNKGRIAVKTDLFSAGAVGVGIDSNYEFDFERHVGSLSLYGVRDSTRDVISPADDEDERYIYRHKHNTMLGDTIYQLNADWMSDPDIYYDIPDRFDPFNRRGRLPERRFRAAFTYLQEDWLSRFSTEYKERITLDRYQDPAELQNDNLLYDPDPDVFDNTGKDTDGVTRRRYARVARKYEGRLATRLRPVFNAPLFAKLEVNAFRNTDAGLNEFSQLDDTEVFGADAYYSVTNRLKLDRNGKFTWLNTVGVGVGYYSRQDDEIIDNGVLGPGPRPTTVDGVPFQDNRTAFLSNGNRRIDAGETNSPWAWADYTSRLNGRLTHDLSGYLQYRVRQGTPNGTGEYYAKSGRTEAFEDIYDFPQDYHWVEAFLNYSPFKPDINLYSRAGYNLQPQNERFANERKFYVGPGADYTTDSGEWIYRADALYEGRQARDYRDPNEFEAEEISGRAEVAYVPKHGRHWASLTVDGSYPLNDDPVAQANAVERRFSEDEPDVSIRPLVGRQFGPKYSAETFVEYNTRIEDIKEAGVMVTRDLYDADLFVYVGTRALTNRDLDRSRSTSNKPDVQQELEFRVGLKLNTPEETSRLSGISRKTLRDKKIEEETAE
ncbi:MAG: hypothetical protein SFY68_08930 [Candidatus Sumerlaeia bacterium]|nr:hypothetical protein [Candidatus Sumerlaeia bacterium]